MFKDKLNYKLLNFLIFAAIVYIGILTRDYWSEIVSKLVSVVAPFLVAFAIAYALYPLVKKLKEKGVSNGLSVAFVSLVITISFIALIAVTVPRVYDQLIVLSKMVSEVISDLSTRLDINLGDFKANVDEILNGIIVSLGKYVSDGTIDFLGKSVSFFTNFIIVYIVSIYFLVDMEKIRNSVKKYLSKMKNRGFKYVKIIDRELGQYMQGLTLFMVIQFFEYSLLFKLVGHPNWLLLGILASLTTIIPYFGGIATNVVAVVLASVVSSKLFVGTLIICLVFPNIDGYIISPRVYGHTNKVNALWTIFACFAGGILFGITGIIISMPVYIILNSTYKFFKNDIYEKIGEIRADAKERED